MATGKGNTTRPNGKREKALQSQTGMGQEYICFFDAENLRQRARKGQKGFLVLVCSILSACLFFFIIEPVSALLQFRKICRKAGQYFSSLSLSFLHTILSSPLSSLLTYGLLRTLACTLVRWQDFDLRRSENLWKSFFSRS